MSENRKHDDFVARLERDMPPVPDDAALTRVNARVRDRAGMHGAPSVSAARVWRIAGALATVAAAAVVAAYMLTPRLDTAAFARERAADALLLPTDGRILHTVTHFTDTAVDVGAGHDSRLDLDQRWESWVDTRERRIREDYVNVKDGSLDNRSVRQGDRVVVFQNNVRYLTGGEQQLIDESHTQQPFGSGIGVTIDYLRERIADGSAKVTGTRTIRDEEYWVVEWTSEEGDIHVVATMRTSDYRLKTWTQEVETRVGNAKGIQMTTATFDTYELLERSDLPADFFDFERVFSAAKPGTRVDRR